MSSFLIGLTNLVPGLAYGLMSQRRAMGIVFGLLVAGILAALVTPWLLWLPIIVTAGSMIEAGLRHRRLQTDIRWSWRLAVLAVAGALALNFVARTLAIQEFKLPSSAMEPTLEVGDHILVNKLAMRWRAPERGEIVVFRQPCDRRFDYIKRVIALEGDTVEIRCDVVHLNGTPAPLALVKADDGYRDRNDPEAREEMRAASRYRETIGDHTYEVFHAPERPAREEARRAGGPAPEEELRPMDFPHDVLQRCASALPFERGPAGTQHPSAIVVTDPAPADPCKPHRHYVVPPGHVFTLGDNRPNSNDSQSWGSLPVENVKGVVTGIWLPLERAGRVD